MFIFVGWSKAIHANHLLYLYHTMFQQLSQEIITFSRPNHAERRVYHLQPVAV